jgi:hypothetical protein
MYLEYKYKSINTTQFCFFESTTAADQTRQAVGNPKSSLAAVARHVFHLLTMGFEPRTFFEVPDKGLYQ